MKKSFVTILLALIMVLTLTACQSAAPSQSNNASSPSTTVAPTAAATVAPTVSAANTASATSQAPAQGFQGPTEKAKAPTGIKVAIVSSDASLSGCIVPANAIEEVGKRYKWQTQIFDGKGTPAQENAAILNAISWGPKVIATVSLDQRSVQQGLTAAKKAGIIIVSGSNGTDDPNPKEKLDPGQLDFPYDVGPNYVGLGNAMAEWMQKDSGGSGGVVVFSCPGVASVDLFQQGLLAGLAKTTLKVDPNLQTFTFDQLGDTLNGMVTSYVTAHPDVKYVFIPFDPAALGPVAALDTAGSDVKVCSVLGTTEMVELIRQGTTAACTAAYDSTYLGYAEADQFIRLLDGQQLFTPHGENLPYAMVDKNSLPAKGSAWVPSYDYKSAFYALWD